MIKVERDSNNRRSTITSGVVAGVDIIMLAEMSRLRRLSLRLAAWSNVLETTRPITSMVLPINTRTSGLIRYQG